MHSEPPRANDEDDLDEQSVEAIEDDDDDEADEGDDAAEAPNSDGATPDVGGHVQDGVALGSTNADLTESALETARRRSLESYAEVRHASPTWSVTPPAPILRGTVVPLPLFLMPSLHRSSDVDRRRVLYRPSSRPACITTVIPRCKTIKARQHGRRHIVSLDFMWTHLIMFQARNGRSATCSTKVLNSSTIPSHALRI